MSRFQRPLGLRARVALVYALGALLITSTVAVATFALVQRQLLGETAKVAEAQVWRNARDVRRDLQLAPEIEPTPQTAIDGDEEPIDRITGILETLAVSNGAQTLLIPADGEPRTVAGLLAREIPLGVQEVAVAGRAASQLFIADDGKPKYVIGLNIAEINAQYYEVVPLEDLTSTLESLRNILIGVALVASIAGAGLGYYSAGRVLQPVRQVARAAEAIAAGQFNTRLEPQADPELSRLTSSFNDMVGALSDRIARDERFTSDVAHELRSPLMTLAASVDVLEHRREQMPPAAQRATDLLSKDLSRFQKLVEDLLEISRIDVGGVQLDNQPFRVMDFMRAVIAHSRTPSVPLECAPEHQHLVISGDKRRLGQVFSNLLDNARKYAGGATRVVVIQVGDRVQIAVHDAGPGVAPADRIKIFDRFARVASDAGRRDVAKGVGLGLALVDEHVQLHGGRVWVDDRTGSQVGARFVVELLEEPLEESDEELAQ